MQLMCDAVTVLGSRHGLLINPIKKECGIIRFSKFEELPKLHVRAGVVIRGKEYVLPLSPKGEAFYFHDQRISPCTLAVSGIDPFTRVKLKLTVVTPFRPRDPDFSTTPVLGLRLEAGIIPGQFRWADMDKEELPEVELFLEFHGQDVAVKAQGKDAVDLTFRAGQSYAADDKRWKPKRETERKAHRDRIVALSGERRGKRFVRRVRLETGRLSGMDFAWCVHEQPVLMVQGKLCPFRYAERFADLDAVADWARAHGAEIFDSALKVDGIVGGHNCCASVGKLMALSLHAWLASSWWTRSGKRDWFSVWEGNCYLKSTVDVEYTQTPFYLAVWPELLGIELRNWTDFSKDGALTLGPRGKGTLFLSHDMGRFCTIGKQAYPHEMEVEETANYIIMAYALWRRTGDDAIIRAKHELLTKYLGFLAACDTSGDGVPTEGVANTIDDASPAVQFGRKQVYLAVKTLAAYACAEPIFAALGKATEGAGYKALAEKLRATIEGKGWLKDHYATLLEKSGKGLIEPWTGKKVDVDAIPGWDAAHIYTVNGIALLDMVGLDLGLDPDRIRKDLTVATAACLREYGCIHSAAANTMIAAEGAQASLVGVARNPGWIAMNMLRDVAAFYRGVDLRYLADRYWDWQVVTNTQEPKLFFETFNGNNLCFYPRGLAIWGFFDALAGQVIDKVAGVDRSRPAFAQVRVPRLFDADWKNGTCRTISRD
jgi:xylan 1,4-beta-xylosidase